DVRECQGTNPRTCSGETHTGNKNNQDQSTSHSQNSKFNGDTNSSAPNNYYYNGSGGDDGDENKFLNLNTHISETSIDNIENFINCEITQEKLGNIESQYIEDLKKVLKEFWDKWKQHPHLKQQHKRPEVGFK